MKAIDPYHCSSIPGPKAAALVIGRSLSRFRFHFTQSALLYVGESDWHDNQTELTSTLRVLESINIRLPGLGFNRLEKISRLLRTSGEGLSGWQLWGGFHEAVRQRDDRRELPDHFDVAREIVNKYVQPRLRQIARAIRHDLGTAGRIWLRLGQVLDYGVCRPDVYRFQRPLLSGWPVLRVDRYTATCFASLKTSISLGGDPPSGSTSTACNAGPSFVRREPGDVVPHCFWWADVGRLWAMAKLDIGLLDPLVRLRTIYAESDTVRNELIAAVEKLFETAHFGAGHGTDRLRIDAKNRIVELDGKDYLVAPQAAFLFLELVDGERSFAKIKEKHPDVFGKHDKLSRLRQSMPSELWNLIEHGTGKTTKLLL